MLFAYPLIRGYETRYTCMQTHAYSYNQPGETYVTNFQWKVENTDKRGKRTYMCEPAFAQIPLDAFADFETDFAYGFVKQ